jgi:hypothetical protein
MGPSWVNLKGTRAKEREHLNLPFQQSLYKYRVSAKRKVVQKVPWNVQLYHSGAVSGALKMGFLEL